MRIREEDILDGTEIPRWYGIAYRDLYRGVTVCYPVGIHLIVAAWHWLAWRFTRAKNYPHMRRPIRTAYHAGYRDALENVRDETIKQIVREALETMQKEHRP